MSVYFNFLKYSGMGLIINNDTRKLEQTIYDKEVFASSLCREHRYHVAGFSNHER